MFQCNFRSHYKWVSFNGAQFKYAEFDGVEFINSKSDFQQAKFDERAKFSRTRFTGVNFQRSEFGGSLSFNECTFLASAPDFRDVKLMEALEFNGTIWPSAPTTIREGLDQVYAYERLKAEMERQKRFEQELIFLGLELRARRALLSLQAKEARYLPWGMLKGRQFLNYLYEVLSNYGQSVGRPTFWLIALCALTTVLLATTPSCNKAPPPVGEALGISLSSALPFLPLKAHGLVASNLSPLAKILIDFHSLLSALFLFLIGLGLRNRFRMK